VIWPQACTASGKVKGVGLELTAIVVFTRRRHVDHALLTAACGWGFSGTSALK